MSAVPIFGRGLRLPPMMVGIAIISRTQTNAAARSA